MSKLTDGYRWQPNVNSCVCVISVAWQSRIFFTKRKFVYYDLVGASVMNSLGFGHFHHLVLFPHAMVDMAGLSEIHLTSFVLMVHWCMNNAFLLFLSLKSYAFNFTVNRTCLLFTLVSTFFFFFFFFFLKFELVCMSNDGMATNLVGCHLWWKPCKASVTGAFCVLFFKSLGQTLRSQTKPCQKEPFCSAIEFIRSKCIVALLGPRFVQYVQLRFTWSLFRHTDVCSASCRFQTTFTLRWKFSFLCCENETSWMWGVLILLVSLFA